MSEQELITDDTPQVPTSKPQRTSKGELSLRVQTQLKEHRSKIIASVPKSCADPNAVFELILTEFRYKPELCECTLPSIMESVQKALSRGFYLGGGDSLSHAYLIPRKNRKMGTVECTLMHSYKGLIYLANLGGMPSYSCRIVYEWDDFAYVFGMIDDYTLHPSDDPRRLEGPITHVVFSTIVQDYRVLDVMTKAEVDAHAAKYSQNYGAHDPLWKTDPPAYAKKTIIRRVLSSGRVPLTPKYAQMIAEAD